MECQEATEPSAEVTVTKPMFLRQQASFQKCVSLKPLFPFLLPLAATASVFTKSGNKNYQFGRFSKTYISQTSAQIFTNLSPIESLKVKVYKEVKYTKRHKGSCANAKFKKMHISQTNAPIFTKFTPIDSLNFIADGEIKYKSESICHIFCRDKESCVNAYIF